jgi:DNA primase
MAEARRDTAWCHTAALLARINNVHASKKSELQTPLDNHPFLGQSDDVVMDLDPAESVEYLKALLLPPSNH